MANPLCHLALATALASSLIANAATAQDSIGDTYISASGLYVVPTDSDSDWTGAEDGGLSAEVEWDAGFGLLVAYGLGTEDGLRGELEVGYRKADVDDLKDISADGGMGVDSEALGLSVDGDMTTLSLMGNGFLTFGEGQLRPYIGAGFGLARHDGTVDLTDGEIAMELSGDDVVFAYQLMGGVGYVMSEGTEVRLGYRYFATGDADFDGDEVSYASHNFEAGVLIRF